ncbi:MAG: DUF2399 domain-containing protein [Dermatophilaceae bacterium]
MPDIGARGTEEPPEWLHALALSRVWDLLAEALERRDLAARGRVQLRDLTRDERHAFTDVLGYPVTTPEIRVDLAGLDRRVAERLGRDLAETVSWVTSRALVDRSGRRADVASRREAPFAAAATWLERRGQQRGAPAPWVGEWLDGLRRDGILTPWEDAVTLIDGALTVLDHRAALDDAGTAAGQTGLDGGTAGAVEGRHRPAPLARTELAARVVGDAHALDDGTRLSLLLLRAAAVRAGMPLPRSAGDRRALWESLGVVRDRVSTTCLTWGLVQEQDSWAASRCPLVGEGAAPLHLTWWDIESGASFARGQTVLVCENPRTLEAIATHRPPDLAVVCTMGRPNLVVRAVLDLVTQSQAVLRYHGDFDWPGIEMANVCRREFGAQPWLMSVGDYTEGHGSQPLKGAVVEAEWDPELAPAMRSRGVAVHEEARLDVLLQRLTELAAPIAAGENAQLD